MADEPNPHATPISIEFASVHVERLRAALETLDVNDEQAKVKVEINSSKVHWSEVISSYDTVVEGPTMDSSSTLFPSSYYTAMEGPAMDSSSTLSRKWVHEEGTPEWELEVVEDNVRVFRSLQEKYPSGFFLDQNDRGPNFTQQLPRWMINNDGDTYVHWEFGLNSETPFAEGGQAKLFHTHVKQHSDSGETKETLVMKVFKEGTPLRDLLQLFPTTMLAHAEIRFEGGFGKSDGNFNNILGAQLLKSSGQFAFLMQRAWRDLRKLIDARMLHFNNQGPPFPNDVAFYIIHHIAMGMKQLHERDIIHRDLKASNVLVFGPCDDKEGSHSIIDPIHLRPCEFLCMVADFECSVGVVGTRFWRAPEILEAVKNSSISHKPELFTKQADVYSFGMTCYEILSGHLPFEKLRQKDFDSVIGGARPMLPSQTPPWMVELVNRCWHEDSSMRPPFEEIVEILEPYAKEVKKENPRSYVCQYFQF